MPCMSDYMEPTRAEIDTLETATLLNYVLKILGKPVPAEVTQDIENSYPKVAHLNSYVRMLCSEIRSMPEEQRNSIVYDGRSKMGRKLADWWEKHEAADKARLKKNIEQKKLLELETRRKRAIERLGKLPVDALEDIIDTYLT